jgi:hypothetical protein
MSLVFDGDSGRLCVPIFVVLMPQIPLILNQQFI